MFSGVIIGVSVSVRLLRLWLRLGSIFPEIPSFQVYVKINEDVSKEIQNTEGDKHGKGDKHDKGEIHRRSMEIFQNMENGKSDIVMFFFLQM